MRPVLLCLALAATVVLLVQILAALDARSGEPRFRKHPLPMQVALGDPRCSCADIADDRGHSCALFPLADGGFTLVTERPFGFVRWRCFGSDGGYAAGETR